MLFKGFTDAKNSRQPEHVVIKRDQHLGHFKVTFDPLEKTLHTVKGHLSKEMSNDSIAKVVKPVILVGRPVGGEL